MSARQIRRARQRADERDTRRERRLGGRTRALAAAGASLGAAVLFAPAADAATIAVTNLDDAGPGSLRDALSEADVTAGYDDVVFDSALSGTLTLASAIIVEDGVDIVGPGAAQVTVRTEADTGLLLFYGFDSQNEPVSISGLTFADGQESFGKGGALYFGDYSGSDAPDVTLSGIVVRDSYSAGAGGALSNRGGDLTIVDSVFTGNVADDDGGAVYHYGETLTISGSTLTGNETDGESNDYGGAIYAKFESGLEEQNMLVRDSLISGGYAYDGAGIYVADVDGPVTIERSTISNNEAVDDSGGLFMSAANRGVTIDASTFAGNTSGEYGGAMSIFGAGGTTIRDSTVSGNSTSGDGGGMVVELDDGATMTVENSTIVGNSAVENGGGLYADLDSADDAVRISSSIVSGNTAGGDGPDLFGSLIESPIEVGFSLIGNPADATMTESPAGSNLLGVDPQLGPLADNGGPTQTHAPAFSSPALDAGVANSLATDQRGAPRTFDAANVANRAGSDGTDIGSVELLPGGRLALAQCKGATENLLFAPGTAIVGSDANDVIVGTDAADNVNSGAGADLICLGAGNDGANTGAGKDRTFGEAGKDRVSAKGGKDTAKGGAGKDTLKGGAGKDKLSGQGGADTLKGQGGADTLKGGAGKDKLRGGPGRDKLKGGGGKDSEVQ